jgi:hypothetical protein
MLWCVQPIAGRGHDASGAFEDRTEHRLVGDGLGTRVERRWNFLDGFFTSPE